MAVSNRLRPAAWKLEAVGAGLGYYRSLFRSKPHPLLVATLTPSLTEMYLQTKSEDAAAVVFEFNDWLVGLQYTGADPRHHGWSGGFRGWVNGKAGDATPLAEGVYLSSLSCACQLTRQIPDLQRHERYRHAAAEAIGFLASRQYIESNTRHYEHAFAASSLIGGVYHSASDGNLRIDCTAATVTAMLRFLPKRR